jgi:hypothetical protein
MNVLIDWEKPVNKDILVALELLKQKTEFRIEHGLTAYLCPRLVNLMEDGLITHDTFYTIKTNIDMTLQGHETFGQLQTFGQLLRTYEYNKSPFVTVWLDSNPEFPNDDNQLRLFFINHLIGKYSVVNNA